MSEPQARRRPAWARLGSELRRLRKQAGLNQEAIRAALGVGKGTVDRYEAGGGRGGAPPSVQAFVTWAQACAVAEPDVPLLRALAAAALDEHSPYRDWGSLAQIQDDIGADEAGALTLRNFNNWGIPGLVQTAEYAHLVLTLADLRRTGDVAKAVAARLRRQVVLSEPGRRFGFLLTEAALRFRPAGLSPAGLRAQLAYLAAAAARPGVELGVIPAGGEGGALPRCPFVLYEDPVNGGGPFAAVELPHERVEARTPGDYAIYRDTFTILWGEALTGNQAAAFVAEAAGR
jgi:transcriptional regulator with XRE-family HTH domain